MGVCVHIVNAATARCSHDAYTKEHRAMVVPVPAGLCGQAAGGPNGQLVAAQCARESRSCHRRNLQEGPAVRELQTLWVRARAPVQRDHYSDRNVSIVTGDRIGRVVFVPGTIP